MAIRSTPCCPSTELSHIFLFTFGNEMLRDWDAPAVPKERLQKTIRKYLSSIQHNLKTGQGIVCKNITKIYVENFSNFAVEYYIYDLFTSRFVHTIYKGGHRLIRLCRRADCHSTCKPSHVVLPDANSALFQHPIIGIYKATWRLLKHPAQLQCCFPKLKQPR